MAIRKAVANKEKLRKVLDHAEHDPKPKKETLKSKYKFDPLNSPFIVRTANEQMEYAASLEVPNMLFGEFIFESDLTVLFASAGVGKTLLAVQIADSIANGNSIEGFRNESKAQKVVYFDLELTPKQFQGRYVEKDQNGKWLGNDYKWSDNMDLVNFKAHEIPKGMTAIDFIYYSIIQVVQSREARIIFIDNISWLATQGLEASKDAGALMRKLDSLKKEHKLTVIVLAHTPKKRKWEAMELSDLAGSAAVGNFIDACFAINWSNYDGENSSRYLKQIKSRFTEAKYHVGNVVTVQLTKVLPNFTGVKRIYFENEAEEYLDESTHLGRKTTPHTAIYTEEESDKRRKLLQEYIEKNPKAPKTEIVKYLGISRPTLYKDIKKLEEQGNGQLFNNKGE